MQRSTDFALHLLNVLVAAFTLDAKQADFDVLDLICRARLDADLICVSDFLLFLSIVIFHDFRSLERNRHFAVPIQDVLFLFLFCN